MLLMLSQTVAMAPVGPWFSQAITGLKVERLDAEGRVLSGIHSTQHLLPQEFLGHSLMEALAAGQLFTPPIRRLG